MREAQSENLKQWDCFNHNVGNDDKYLRASEEMAWLQS